MAIFFLNYLKRNAAEVRSVVDNIRQAKIYFLISTSLEKIAVKVHLCKKKHI